MSRHVKGILFADYVRMIRGHKTVEWRQHLHDEDLRYLLARVSALEQTSEARITASPKVATLDHVEAVMDNKTTFYVPVAGYQSADLYSVSAGTSLRVLPMVVPEADGGIRLTIHIEDGQLTGQLVGQLPVVSNSEIDTEALIRDGESLLIGGYSVEQSTTGNTDVPFLSKLPLVGELFRYHSKDHRHSEIMVFITPHLLDENGKMMQASVEAKPQGAAHAN